MECGEIKGAASSAGAGKAASAGQARAGHRGGGPQAESAGREQVQAGLRVEAAGEGVGGGGGGGGWVPGRLGSIRHFVWDHIYSSVLLFTLVCFLFKILVMDNWDPSIINATVCVTTLHEQEAGLCVCGKLAAASLLTLHTGTISGETCHIDCISGEW